jgi:hypothetical protein
MKDLAPPRSRAARRVEAIEPPPELGHFRGVEGGAFSQSDPQICAGIADLDAIEVSLARAELVEQLGT